MQDDTPAVALTGAQRVVERRVVLYFRQPPGERAGQAVAIVTIASTGIGSQPGRFRAS
jgi:hypothetical protein